MNPSLIRTGPKVFLQSFCQLPVKINTKYVICILSKTTKLILLAYLLQEICHLKKKNVIFSKYIMTLNDVKRDLGLGSIRLI